MSTASISRRRVTARRLLGTTAVAVVLSTAGATSAWAGDCPGGKGWGSGKPSSYKPGNGDQTGPGQKPTTPIEACSFSLDGKNYSTSVKVDDASLKPSADGKVHLWVKAAAADATCIVSLASYKTHGATWDTSGEQMFWDFDTLGVTGETTDSLDVAVPDVGCYAQVDLYKGSTRYDGSSQKAPLPIGPSKKVIGDKLIAAWNGGTKDCTTPPSPTPTESAPGSSAPTPTASGPAPGSTSSATPAEPAPESESESASASVSTTPSEAAATASSEPSPAGGLAETGSSGTGIALGIAAALLAAGGGVMFLTRRRKAAGRH